MTDQKYAKITSAVYELLEFFPESEPLGLKAKEKALAIMENLVLASSNNNSQKERNESAKQAFRDIEILESYLALGKARSWIDNMNLLIVLKEYEQIKKDLNIPVKEEKIVQKPPVDNNVDKPLSLSLNERQGKIIEMLSSKEKAQVLDFQKVLPTVTKRTIRRDLDELLRMGKIERAGEWNQVAYKLYKQVSPINQSNSDQQKEGGTERLLS